MPISIRKQWSDLHSGSRCRFPCGLPDPSLFMTVPT